MAKHIRGSFLLVLIIAVLSSCKQKPEIAGKLYDHYKNKTYKDFDTAAYHAEFKKQLAILSPQLRYAQIISDYYHKQNFEPVFVNQFLVNGQIRTLVDYLSNANEHGLDTAAFH